jgi:hypothetical protein
MPPDRTSLVVFEVKAAPRSNLPVLSAREADSSARSMTTSIKRQKPSQPLHFKRSAPHLFPNHRRSRPSRRRAWTYAPSPLSMSDDTENRSHSSANYSSSLEYTDIQQPEYSRQEESQLNWSSTNWSSTNDSSAYVQPEYSRIPNLSTLSEASFSTIGNESIHESYCHDFGRVQPQVDSSPLGTSLPPSMPSTTSSRGVTTQSAHLSENLARPASMSFYNHPSSDSLLTIIG